jgi:hypothetical protein
MRWIDADRRAAEYATNEDYRRLFSDEMNRLYLLCFLLTANHERAADCLLAGLDECMSGSFVFRGWAGSWARRTLVRNAIRLMAPDPGPIHSNSDRHSLAVARSLPQNASSQIAFAKMLALDDFERFVFVLSVLERYLDHNCAVLLGTTQRRIRDARERALRQLADVPSLPAPHSRLSYASAGCR